jgi:hypothetical protein
MTQVGCAFAAFLPVATHWTGGAVAATVWRGIVLECLNCLYSFPDTVRKVAGGAASAMVAVALGKATAPVPQVWPTRSQENHGQAQGTLACNAGSPE